MNENEIIALGIWQLDNFTMDREYTEHYKELMRTGSTLIHGFEFQREGTLAWSVWKSTSFEEHPEFKGESLVKVVPRSNLDKEQIIQILEAQPWIYL